MFLRSLIVTVAAVALLTPAVRAQATPAASAKKAHNSSSIRVQTNLKYTPIKIRFGTASTNYVKNIHPRGVRIAVPKRKVSTFTKQIAAKSTMARPRAFKGIASKQTLSKTTKASVTRSRAAFEGINNKVWVKSGSVRGKVR